MPKSKKQQLKDGHEKKLMELYENYYNKALGDPNSFRAFNDVAKCLFADSEENELLKILNNAKVGED